MKKCILTVMVFWVMVANAQVLRIDHVTVSSSNADKIFTFFKNELQLPVTWNYQGWSNFSSGAISLGNLYVEFINDGKIKDSKFTALALEPKQVVKEFAPMLHDSHIVHDNTLEVSRTTKEGLPISSQNIILRNLLPVDVGLFVCDYTNRAHVSSAVEKNAAELGRREGGPLGVLGCKEIVVGSPYPEASKKNILKLPGILTDNTNLFTFPAGAAIRLLRSEKGGIEKIVIRVRSIAQATGFLKENNLLGTSHASGVYIDPKAVSGLMIELVTF